ncbi:hypothetical protein K493DRAFT_339405 [Basidiobolus meristosporus CBS 931.73]|uniref:Ribosomal protein S36, mitochondrial n=1 Tax=Basidiobolus meristosporus CBS 931.73 TaxID=1314790 RepID=A0A1Y1Y050_9FUNG|nr:hypothetical protein K493DRAFT_339405 [Basidiobolus meristosporus CBS 931.73]|eukprot:ORX91380.1 hypothetical protein K493DRAFT_339405 [Basidiobolus meristosporus CBS 931.73]
MQPTFVRLAVTVPKKHVPLIKFLGPRKKLNLQNTYATQNTISNTNSVSQKAAEKSSVTYNELPARFKRIPLTPEEIEAVEMGGAGFVY